MPKGVKPPMQLSKGLHSRKMPLCVFWDIDGVLWWDLIEGTTVDGIVYKRQLLELAANIKASPRRRRAVKLLHDNARPHKCKLVREAIEQLNWTEVPHTPYSPGLAPSDYHLFARVKDALRGKKLKDSDAVRQAVGDFFKSQTTEFWRRGIEKLPQRWESVVKSHGDYFVD